MKTKRVLICTIVIVSLLIVYKIINNQREKTLDDCYRLQTNVAVTTCIIEVSKRAEINQSRPKGSVNYLHDLSVLSLTETKLESYTNVTGGLNYRLSGVLHNNSQLSLKNIKITVKFYREGDNPENFQPLDSGGIILQTVESGKSLRFQERLTGCCTQIQSASNFTWTSIISSAEIIK